MSMKRAPVVNRPLSKAKNGTSLNITITPSKNLQNQDKAKAARTKHLRCDIPSPSPSSQPTSRRMRSRRSSTRRRHRQGSRASAKHTAKRPARFLGDDAANSMSDAVAGHHCGGLGRAEELDVMREGSQVILQRYLPGVGRAYVAADRGPMAQRKVLGRVGWSSQHCYEHNHEEDVSLVTFTKTPEWWIRASV